MICASTWFIISLAIVGISADYYSTTCEELASQCDYPTPAQLEIFKTSLHVGGCAIEASLDEQNRFAKCAIGFNPEIFQKITEKTNSDQKCRETIGFNKQQPGVDPKFSKLVAECNIIGTPQEDCFYRCAICLRGKALGFDPTEQLIQAFQACPMNTTTYSYGTSA